MGPLERRWSSGLAFAIAATVVACSVSATTRPLSTGPAVTDVVASPSTGAGASSGPGPTRSPRPTIGPCPTGAAALDCLSARLEAFGDAGIFHGQVLIARSGEIAWEGVFGRDSAGAPLTAHSRLGLASVGKMLTAVSVGQLVDAERLAFTDPVGKYVEGLPDDVADSTVAELLSHTAGLPMYDWHLGRTSPRGEFSYSNAGFDLLDLAVEHVVAASVVEYQTINIVEPAGMVDTRFDAEPSGSTARDMLRFVDAVFANELMSARTTTAMTTQKVATADGGYGYGFAMFTGEASETPSIGHIGVAPGVVAVVETAPSIATTVVVMCREGFGDVQPALVEYQKAIGMGYWRG